jgi:hypothetical protein
MSNDNYMQLAEINKRRYADSPNLKTTAKRSFHRKKIEVELMCNNEEGRSVYFFAVVIVCVEN